MLSIPARPHFIGQFFLVDPEKRGHFGAMATEEDQFASLPVLPSRSINTELAARLTGRPAVHPALAE